MRCTQACAMVYAVCVSSAMLCVARRFKKGFGVSGVGLCCVQWLPKSVTCLLRRAPSVSWITRGERVGTVVGRQNRLSPLRTDGIFVARGGCWGLALIVVRSVACPGYPGCVLGEIKGEHSQGGEGRGACVVLLLLLLVDGVGLGHRLFAARGSCCLAWGWALCSMVQCPVVVPWALVNGVDLAVYRMMVSFPGDATDLLSHCKPGEQDYNQPADPKTLRYFHIHAREAVRPTRTETL